jgi:hypothetical protein
MDLNYLYLRRGVSLARANRALCGNSRLAHLGLHDAYDARITAARAENRA